MKKIFIILMILALFYNINFSQVNGYKRFIVTANASGLLSPPFMGTYAFNALGFPTLDGLPPNNNNDRPLAGQQTTNVSLWGIATGSTSPTMDNSYTYFLYRVTRNGANWLNIIPYDFEIRFTSTGSQGQMAYTSGTIVQLPFEIWNTGIGTPNDPTDDYKLVTFIYDANQNEIFDLDKVDHTVDGSDDDPETDWIYIYDVADHTPGTSGYDAAFASGFTSGMGSEVMARLTLVNWNGGSVSAANWPNNLNSIMPENGTIFRIETVAASPQTCFDPPQGMVGWWTGDNNATDISGFGNSGSLHGSIIYGTGKVDNTFVINSHTDFIEVANNQSLNFNNSQNFSIDAWIRTTQTDRATIVDKRSGTNTNPVGYTFFVALGKLGFQLGDGSPFINNMSNGPTINDGNWHHVAVTINRTLATGGKLYVDGILNYTFDPTTFPGNISNTANLWIGQHQISSAQTYHSFQGAIDELEIFNKVLTANEIYSMYLSDHFGKCKPTTDVKTNCHNDLPSGYLLTQNYPNPFNPTTTISYQIPVAGYVSLKIYDMLGREVTTLVNEFQNPGYYAKTFDGSSLSSGTYFYRLQTGKYYETLKLLILK